MNDGFATSMSDIFDDLFGDFVGRRGRGDPSGKERGADLRYNLEITLEEAYHGKTATIKLPTAVTCEACGGSGAKAGSKPTTCKTCAGHGRVRAQQGFFAIERTCPACGGRGVTIENPCDRCGGAGRVTRERTLSVNVPAGVEDGTRIRLAGEGEAGLRGGATGDLYIFLSVKPHPVFQRDGADLYCRVPISMVRPRSAASSPCGPSTAATRRCAFPKACSRAIRCGCAARACRCCARWNTATSTSRRASRRRRT